MIPPGPTPAGRRIAVLDALRGFALSGILFVNLTWFTGYAVMSASEKEELGTAAMDRVVYWLVQVFVDGKFWSLFAFLFGVGIAIQSGRARQSGTSFWKLHLRRCIVLLCIGLLHAIFLWFGDIVSLYAVAGLVMLLFYRCSNRGVLIRAVVFLLLPVFQSGLWLVLHHWHFGPGSTDPGYGPAALIPLFGSGTYREVFHANQAFLKERWVIAVYDGRFLKLCGMFLLGWWAGRQNIFGELAARRRLLYGVLVAGCLIGIPANVCAASLFPEVTLRPPSGSGWLLELVRSIGVPLLCLAYVAAIGLIWPAIENGRVSRWFAAVGRMSLTHYILQTTFCVVFFYGYGMGQWGRFGPAWSVAVVGAVLAIQVGFSRWWLGHFRQGPLEWLCRCLTYGRRLPLAVSGDGKTSNRQEMKG